MDKKRGAGVGVNLGTLGQGHFPSTGHPNPPSRGVGAGEERELLFVGNEETSGALDEEIEGKGPDSRASGVAP